MAITYPINKVAFGSTNLIDVSDATVVESTLSVVSTFGSSTGSSSDILIGKTAYGKSGVKLTGTCTYNADTSDATISDSSELLYGVSAYNASGVSVTGTMANNGGATVTVSALAGTTIPAGYYDGTGVAVIDAASIANMTPTNIRDGVTILGVTGEYTGAATPTYTSITVTPLASWATDQVYLPSSYSVDYFNEVTVGKIETQSTQTSGTSGYTVIIGGASV